MTPVTLNKFVDDRGQIDAARRLGLSQAAVSKAVRSGRSIYVVSIDSDQCAAFELKPFPALGSSGKTTADLEEIISISVRDEQHPDGSVHPSSTAQAFP
ncbi:hypothetical protein JET76_23910 [Pseudomonas putida]|uniref:Cro/CI family transcriptional regulator n=1 Tax=Pseudomonas putida TaxID=303 RepID=UPI0018E6A4DE|nr:Cro/CI family transcriptional regulator [Pseudomonas putida]MBI6944373.1 hypothetical protein [Pseudomonas putida]MBI6960685.1 hypothetical protein [Pseudomonas putida]